MQPHAAHVGCGPSEPVSYNGTVNGGVNAGENGDTGDSPTDLRTLADVNGAGPWADQWAAADTTIHVLDALLARRGGVPAAPLTAANVLLDGEGNVALTGLASGDASGRPADQVVAVGAMLYEMLTGQPPSGVDAHSALRLRSDIDPRLAAVVAKALSAQPSARFTSPREFRDVLDSLRVSLSGSTELRRVSLEPAGITGVSAPALVRPSRWPMILTVLSLLVAGGLGFLFFSNRSDDSSPSTSVAVPNLAGMPSADAEKSLLAVGLTSKIILEPSVAVAQGNVIRSSPPAGTQLAKGAQVIVVVSGQAVPGTVPALVGLGQSEAQSILSQFGLVATFEQASDSAPAGTVIRQTPEPGTTVAAGSSVTLTISSGPAVGTTTTTTTPTTTTSTTTTTTGAGAQVPSLVGQMYETASSMLTQSGLVLGSITYQASVQLPGTVISQTPAPGASVTEGSAVSVVVAE